MKHRFLVFGLCLSALAAPALAQGPDRSMSTEAARQIVVESCGHTWPRARTDISGSELILKRLGPDSKARAGVNFDETYRLQTRIDFSKLNFSAVNIDVKAGPQSNKTQARIGFDASTAEGRRRRAERIRQDIGAMPAFGQVTVECATSEPCVTSSFNQRLQCDLVFDSDADSSGGLRKAEDFGHREECRVENAGSTPFSHSSRQIYFDCFNPVEAIDALYVLHKDSSE